MCMLSRGKGYMMTILTKTSLAVTVIIWVASFSVQARPITKTVETVTQHNVGDGYSTRPMNYAELPAINSSIDQREAYIDLTTVSVRTVWPEGITTVREASNYILDTIGYRLVTEYPAPTDANRLANQKIPPIAKVHRTMPIIDVLQMLIGLDNYVVVDHDHKLISFTKRAAR